MSRPGVLVAAVATLAALLLGLRLFVVETYRVPAVSMEPTLSCGGEEYGCTGGTDDRILVVKLLDEPRRGDVVAFRVPDQAEARCGTAGTYVKRVVGLPGERFEMRGGRVIIDGEVLDEPYVRRRATDTLPERVVAEDEYYVLGDNRPFSCDSRVWGPLPAGNVIGRVVFRYWPLERVGTV